MAAGLGNRHGAVLGPVGVQRGPVTVGELARQLGLGLDETLAKLIRRPRSRPDAWNATPTLLIGRRTLVSLRTARGRADVEQFIRARRTAPLVRAMEQLTVGAA